MKTTLLKLTKKNIWRTIFLIFNISIKTAETKLSNDTTFRLIWSILMKLSVFLNRSAKSHFCRSLTFMTQEPIIRTTTCTILERSLQDLQIIPNKLNLIRECWRLIAIIVNYEISSLYRGKHRCCLREENVWPSFCYFNVGTTLTLHIIFQMAHYSNWCLMENRCSRFPKSRSPSFSGKCHN